LTRPEACIGLEIIEGRIIVPQDGMRLDDGLAGLAGLMDDGSLLPLEVIFNRPSRGKKEGSSKFAGTKYALLPDS
jgi:hypothetical protein